MDGNYQNKEEDLKLSIFQQWITEIIKNKYWDNYRELHIDEISRDFDDYKNWFEEALVILEIFRECLYDDYKVLLVIELNYLINSMENSRLDWEFLKNNISHFTPPAFYLFPKNDSKLIKTLKI
ncbi:hypothetical protein SAMN05421741_12411 [Paenimyroides ummariense]|uniref:Uncharacterized protein n=1 Tax=Paenimyroides ummariense TaxID=913024 RepID=A0A1I5F1H3_9FLAO|nr:hypothetical protein [Paenimyroides ummariense]SFO17595.1 hypothetical protein SAMN05421741_12411 [Paenimyroides ummariense]